MKNDKIQTILMYQTTFKHRRSLLHEIYFSAWNEDLLNITGHGPITLEM